MSEDGIKVINQSIAGTSAKTSGSERISFTKTAFQL